MSSSEEIQVHSWFIAVVDDDPSFLRSMVRLLRVEGYNARCFASPGEFLNSLSSARPRCVVIDVHMPELSGVELQAHFVSQGTCLPTILVTAHDTPQTREQVRRLGVARLLLKPFDGEVLLEAIRNLTASAVPQNRV